MDRRAFIGAAAGLVAAPRTLASSVANVGGDQLHKTPASSRFRDDRRPRLLVG
jgi:hypothetical protein